MRCRLCADAIMLMHATRGPDRELLRPIHDALNQAVTMAICSWLVNGTTLDDLGEVLAAIHGDVHYIVWAHSAEILTLAATTESRLRRDGAHKAADKIERLIQSMARAIVHDPPTTPRE